MNIAEFVPSHASTWGEVTPEAMQRGLGGRETAALSLAIAWAREGHHVEVFTNVEEASLHRYGSGRCFFLPQAQARPMMACMPYDAVLSWEAPELFTDEAVRKRCKAMICGMQVAHNTQPQARRAPDVWVALSPWHRDFLRPQLADGAMIDVIPNGVHLSRFELPRGHYHPHLSDAAPALYKGFPRFVYSSSPDRGLHHLLEAWPLIREAMPQAELHVCYGAERWLKDARWLHNSMGDMAVAIEQGLQLPGVVDHGRIGQDELTQMLLSSQALLYPCDTLAPTETGCIAILEAMAAGTPVITTDCDCLDSEFGLAAEIVPLPFDAQAYAERVIAVMGDEEAIARLMHRGRTLVAERDWPILAHRWVELFERIGAASGRSYGFAA